MLLRQFDQLLMRHPSRSNQDHSFSRIILLDVIHEVITLDAGDVLLRPQDGPVT